MLKVEGRLLVQWCRGMAAREIKSPEVRPATPASLGGSSETFRRKKLSIYFLESDDRRRALGGGYVGGTTPVDIHGKPIPDLSKTGGWVAALFIFGKPTSPLFFYFLFELLICE